MKTNIIRVNDMACGYCEFAVQDPTRKLLGSKKAKASKRKKLAEVEYDETQIVLEQLLNAINTTSY